MRPLVFARPCRAWLVGVCIGVVVTAASAAVPTAAQGPAPSNTSASVHVSCPWAHSTPGQASTRRLGAALRCLVNRQRRRRDVARLGAARALDRIAGRFATDMRDRGYFGHRSPDGYGPDDRRRSLRLRAIGEVLAWGCGGLSTPAAAVRGWLASPAHRRVVLSRRYELIGTGVAPGVPGRTCGRAASTSVALMGRRR
jgi:uncharacterized protein YkwD